MIALPFDYIPIKVPFVDYDPNKTIHPAQMPSRLGCHICTVNSEEFKLHLANCVYRLSSDVNFTKRQVDVLLPLILHSGMQGGNPREKVVMTESLKRFIYNTYLYKFIVPNVNGHGDAKFSSIYPLSELLGCSPTDLNWSFDLRAMIYLSHPYPWEFIKTSVTPMVRIIIHHETWVNRGFVIEEYLPSDYCIEIEYQESVEERTLWSVNLINNPDFNPELPF